MKNNNKKCEQAFCLLSKRFDLQLFFKLNVALRSYMYAHRCTHAYVIMKYVCTPTNPVNLHVMLKDIVILMVPYGIQNGACDKFSKQSWPKDVAVFFSSIVLNRTMQTESTLM